MSEVKLSLLAEILDNHIPSQPGNNAYPKIEGRENVLDGEKQGLPLPIGAGKFPHQKVGIEEKEDETDLDDRPLDRGRFSGVVGVGRHWETIAGNYLGGSWRFLIPSRTARRPPTIAKPAQKSECSSKYLPVLRTPYRVKK
ncbi:MAG: hypothetical protein WAM91_16660 [Candidatus Acidiferrales bacterium]